MRLVSILACSLVAGSFVLVNCADKGDEGFFILNNTAVTGASCTTTGDPSQPFTSSGQIAAQSAAGYYLTPLLESRITAVTGHESERTIHLEGANVTAAVANGGAQKQYTVLFSGSLAPNGGTTNVGFEVLPAQTMRDLVGTSTDNVQLVVTVAPYGSLGGGRIDGEPFQYPITVIAKTNNSIVVDQGVCKGFMGSTLGSTNACNAYQDGQIACCHKSTVKMGSADCGGSNDNISCTFANGSGALVCPPLAD